LEFLLLQVLFIVSHPLPVYLQEKAVFSIPCCYVGCRLARFIISLHFLSVDKRGFLSISSHVVSFSFSLSWSSSTGLDPACQWTCTGYLRTRHVNPDTLQHIHSLVILAGVFGR